MFIQGNGEGYVTVTPAGSGDFTVTIDGTSYTQAFNSDVATTLDDFVAAHAEPIASAHNILAQDGTTTLNLFRTVGHSISSNGTAVSAESFADIELAPFADVDTVSVSGAGVVLTVGSATWTVTFINAATAEAMAQEFAYKPAKLAARSTESPYVFSKAGATVVS